VRELSGVHKQYDEGRKQLLGMDNAATDISKLSLLEENDVGILENEISL
jgi:hypothetical protein